MFMYLTPVASKYRLKFIASTETMFSEPDDIVSSSSSSGISESGCISPVCCRLVPCPVSFVFFLNSYFVYYSTEQPFSFNFFLPLLVRSLHSSPQELVFSLPKFNFDYFCSAFNVLGGFYLFHCPWV